jgi:hypothetical protein
VELLLLLLGSWLGRGPDAEEDFFDVLVTPPWRPVADAFALLFPRTPPLPVALGLCRDSGWGMISISSLGVGNSPPGVSDGEGKGAEMRMLAALGEGEWCPSEMAGWWERGRERVDGCGGWMNLLCCRSIWDGGPGERAVCSLERECCLLIIGGGYRCVCCCCC